MARGAAGLPLPVPVVAGPLEERRAVEIPARREKGEDGGEAEQVEEDQAATPDSYAVRQVFLRDNEATALPSVSGAPTVELK